MQLSDRIGRRMKLHDLHVLMAVVQAGSMSKAAQILNTTQPAISRSIADLEHTIGVRLLGPALYDILDTAPRGGIGESVREAAASVAGVRNIDKCLIRKMGLDFYVDLHVEVDGSITVREGHDIAHQVKRAIQQTDPRIADVLVHIEPVASGR